MKNTLFDNVNNILFKLYYKVQALKNAEEGQDLVEYGLIMGLICLGAVTSMGTIGNHVNNIFNRIATDIASADH